MFRQMTEDFQQDRIDSGPREFLELGFVL